VCQWAAEEKEYIPYKETRRTFGYKEDQPSDALFKMTNSGKAPTGAGQKNQAVLKRYRIIMDYLGLPRRMTPKKMMLSGKLNYIKELMKRENLSFENCVRKYEKKIDYIYPCYAIRGSVIPFIRKYEMYCE
jgi:hypothetical protein